MKISFLKIASINASLMVTDILSVFQGFTPSISISDNLRLLSHCRKNHRCPKERMQYTGKPEHTRLLIKVIGHYINIFDRPQCLKNVFVLGIIISGLNLNSFCQYWLVSSMACSKWWSQMIWNLVDVKMVPLHTMCSSTLNCNNYMKWLIRVMRFTKLGVKPSRKWTF